MLKKLLNKLKPKKEEKLKPILKAKPNKDRPSKEALLRFLVDDGDIKMEEKNKATLRLKRGDELTIGGVIYIYSTIQVLEYLKVEITNKPEIIDYLEKRKRPDTGVYISPGYNLNLNDSIHCLNIFKLLGHKINNPELKESLLSFKTKKNKLKRYISRGSTGIGSVLKLMSKLNIPFDKKYWTKEITKNQLSNGCYAPNRDEKYPYIIGYTENIIKILKILDCKSNSLYLRKALDVFKAHYKGNYTFHFEDEDEYDKKIDVQLLTIIFDYLKLFQGLENYGYKKDFIQAVYDSWGNNNFHRKINNHEKSRSVMYQAFALEILDILGGQQLIDEVMQIKN